MIRRIFGSSTIAVLVAATTAFGMAGCGSKATPARLVVLFDATASQSHTTRNSFQEDARLLAEAFCQAHPSRSSILLDVITASAESADAAGREYGCPSGVNETQRADNAITFTSNMQLAVQQTSEVQDVVLGSDVMGTVLKSVAGARANAGTSDADVAVVVFSDMQQTGDNVRNCVANQAKAAGAAQEPDIRRCLAAYFEHHRSMKARGSLDGVLVYAAGVGKTIRGAVPGTEGRGYRAFWQRFFRDEGATVCRFDGGAWTPRVNRGDQVRYFDPGFFKRPCRSAF